MIFDDYYVRSMLAALVGREGDTVVLTYAGGATVTGVLTAGAAAPDQFHSGGQRYLTATGGAQVWPNWGAACAITFPAS